jgi:hypothetical protein
MRGTGRNAEVTIEDRLFFNHEGHEDVGTVVLPFVRFASFVVYNPPRLSWRE